MKLKIQKGKAIIITGARCSGKTTLALQLIENAGFRDSYKCVTMNSLRSQFGLGFLGEEHIDVVLVDEFTRDSNDLKIIKSLISSKNMMVRKMYKAYKKVPTPNFIFTTGHLSPLNFEDDERRFLVIEL